MKHLGDITKINGAEIPVVDVITGGSPCQDLSVAGKRAGLDGERSGLFMEQIRIVKEMREHDRRDKGSDFNVRPRWLVWENVPGAFSSNGGKDFQAVLSEIVRIVEPDAPDVPMPPKKWSKAGCLYDEMGRWSIAWRVHDAQYWGVPQRRKRIALVADFGGLAAPEVCFERKGLCGDFDEIEEEKKEIAEATEECALHTIGRDIRSAGLTEDEITDPLMSNDYKDPIKVALYGKAISFQERAGKPGGGKGILIQNEHVGALSTLKNQSVFTFNTKRIGAKEDRTNYENKSCTTLTADENNCCAVNNAVRRLTPLECERLQGFPDGWTDIGEWVDTKGKKHKDADSPRYKALGNSIALPFWFWLLRRIAAQYERPATLGSLFDGIGGFPLCWERCNGKGTAVWASEIEEFPIAVTKWHFPEEGE